MIRKRAIKLAVDGGELPTEFRLFVKGWNETENGRFLFDDAAAKSVMAAYKSWGVDVMIDLEHGMLEVEPGAPDPTARDARGWCALELRPDGSLWAVDVRWTPDGAQRLEQKRQRYISPAFETDPKTKRVVQIINVAITALPATHKTPALVAASKGKNGMDPSLVKQALEAIEKGDAKAALDILKGLVASAAGADPDADGDDDGSEGDGAEGVAPPETEAVEDPEVVENDAADGDGPPSSKSGSDDDDDGPPAKKAARKALHAMLCRITGKKTLAEAVAEVDVFRASHLTLETERQKLAKERATLESAERRGLCAELVRLGAEFPSTVWADPTSKQPVKLKSRWQNMPLEELQSHVAEQRAARGNKAPAAPKPPHGKAGAEVTELAVTLDDGKIVQLSADEVRICKSHGADPKDFAALKVRRDSAKG